MDRISERAAQWGIETQYRDAAGRLRTVDREALARVMAAVGAGAKPDRRLPPRTVVLRRGSPRPLRLEAPARATVQWEISGNEYLASGKGIASRIAFPDDLPPGTYRLVVAVRSSGRERREAANLLCAPHRAFQGAENAPRLWALAVQLYSVRSRHNWGHGDFTDLAGLVELAGAVGAAGIALNPLHALFDDRAEQASPYSPNTRLFLNPLYIDVEAVPEFPGLRAAGLDQEVETFRRLDLVDYRPVAGAKMRALALAYDVFRQERDSGRVRAFESFRRDHGPTLRRFACFEFLRRRFGRPWWDWPEVWRRPADAALDDLCRAEAAAVGFFEFVQWLADQQLDACRQRASALRLPIGLYLDVAVGVRPEGFDAWSGQDSILPGLAVGAPPDPYNAAGQNWGLAGFNPVGLEEQQFEPFRRMLQAAMRHAGAIRLDHVLGLKRLYLIPEGFRPDRGVYVRFPFEALLAATAHESVQNQCIAIGEDLGTVPDGFRETISDWGIWSYQVMLFERAPDGSFLPPEHYREDALVAFNTHDLPTFAGWMSGDDLAIRRELGIDPGETDEQRRTAQAALREALSACGFSSLDFPAVAGFLAQTPSRLAVIGIEDVLGLREQMNVPGTVDQYPNWRRRLPVLLEDLECQEGLTMVAKVMRSAGRSSG